MLECHSGGPCKQYSERLRSVDVIYQSVAGNFPRVSLSVRYASAASRHSQASALRSFVTALMPCALSASKLEPRASDLHIFSSCPRRTPLYPVAGLRGPEADERNNAISLGGPNAPPRDSVTWVLFCSVADWRGVCFSPSFVPRPLWPCHRCETARCHYGAVRASDAKRHTCASALSRGLFRDACHTIRADNGSCPGYHRIATLPSQPVQTCLPI